MLIQRLLQGKQRGCKPVLRHTDLQGAETASAHSRQPRDSLAAPVQKAQAAHCLCLPQEEGVYKMEPPLCCLGLHAEPALCRVTW